MHCSFLYSLRMIRIYNYDIIQTNSISRNEQYHKKVCQYCEWKLNENINKQVDHVSNMYSIIHDNIVVNR